MSTKTGINLSIQSFIWVETILSSCKLTIIFIKIKLIYSFEQIPIEVKYALTDPTGQTVACVQVAANIIDPNAKSNPKNNRSRNSRQKQKSTKKPSNWLIDWLIDWLIQFNQQTFNVYLL